MKKSDLKHGMWVRIRSGELCFVTYPYDDTALIITNDDGYDYVISYNDDLTADWSDMERDIMEVFEPEWSNRPLNVNRLVSIWKRGYKKKMTVAEVEAVLGYAVEIVSWEGEV